MRELMKRIQAKLILMSLDKFDKLNNTVTTYRVKQLTTNRELTRKKNSDFRNVGILIQGQLVPGVTLGICTRYLSLYPDLKIVFSTWEDDEHLDIQRIKELGIAVIYNEKPNLPGPSNVNLQITSTKNGLEYLAKEGVERVLKNRSDGMLSSDYFIEYLQFLYDKYSEDGRRIIVPSYNSFLFRLYSPTDQFQFGGIEILLKYWSCPLSNEATIEFRFAESYLLRQYLSSLDRQVSFTIEDSLVIYRDFFVIADNAQLGLVLNKGTKIDVGNRWANDGFPQAYSEIHNWQWLDLHTNTGRYLKYHQELLSYPDS
jgi:hypothetical protein